MSWHEKESLMVFSNLLNLARCNFFIIKKNLRLLLGVSLAHAHAKYQINQSFRFLRSMSGIM